MKSIFNRPFSDYLFPFLVWVLSLAYVITALGYGPQARLLPLLVGIALLVMLPFDLISISDTPLGRKISGSINQAAKEEKDDLGGVRPQLRALGAMLAFALLLPLLGIAMAIPLYVAASLRVLGRKTWTQAVLTGAIVGLGTYLLFELALDIRLYPGLLLAAS